MLQKGSTSVNLFKDLSPRDLIRIVKLEIKSSPQNNRHARQPLLFLFKLWR